MRKPVKLLRNAAPGIFLLLTVTVLTAMYVLYIWMNVENEQIHDSLHIARSIEAILPTENLKALEISPSDLEKPDYQALKKALKAAIQVNPEVRFAYILVEKNGRIYFVADSEPVDSKDYSPPGQEYTEAKPQDKQPFLDGKELITASLTDRWGTWRSVLIPVKDELTGKTIAIFGMDFNAKTWNKHLLFKLIQSSAVILLLLAFLFAVKFQTKNKLLFMEIAERKKAEAELKKSLDRNKAMLGANPDIMFIFDSECRIVDFHAESNDQLLMPPELFMGKIIDDLFPPEIGEMTHLKVNAVLSTGLSEYSTYELQVEDKLEYFECRYELCGSDQVLAIVRDITERKQTEAAIFKSRQQYETLVAKIPVGIYILHSKPDGAFALDYVSPRMSEMLNLSAERLLADANIVPQSIHPDDLDRFVKLNNEGIQLMQPFDWIGRMWVNGTIKWLHFSSLPELIENGDILWHGLIVDITEHKQAEEFLFHSEAKYRMLTENMKDVVWVLDTQAFSFTYLSPSVEKLRGYTPEEIISQSVESSFLAEDIKEFKSIMGQRIQEFLSNPDTPQKFYVDEMQQPCKDGTNVWIEVIYQYYLNQETNHIEMRGVSRDISERKKAEAEIKLKNEELINLNATKDKFFSIIAHDLRSPFNGFLGLTQIMAEDLSSLTMAQVQNIAANLSKSATNIYRLLENLLQWSQIQKGAISFNPERVQLLAVAKESILMVQETANIKGVEIINLIPEETVILADNNILQTVIRNLVSNAVKYTKRGGEVILSAQSRPDGFIYISVKDTGIGMSQAIIDNLFPIDMHNNRKGTEGEPSTGLGLLLCKEFVEKHGGKIWANSKVGKGSTFYFTVPNK